MIKLKKTERVFFYFILLTIFQKINNFKYVYLNFQIRIMLSP